MSFKDRARSAAQRAAAVGKTIAENPEHREALTEAAKDVAGAARSAVIPSVIPGRRTRAAVKAGKAVLDAGRVVQEAASQTPVEPPRGAVGNLNPDQFAAPPPSERPPWSDGSGDFYEFDV